MLYKSELLSKSPSKHKTLDDNYNIINNDCQNNKDIIILYR